MQRTIKSSGTVIMQGTIIRGRNNNMGKNKSTKADGINTQSDTQHLEDRRRISKGANRKNAPSPK